MGGKTCFVKQVALIALMAQVGCFVPAETCELSLFDNVLVRVGGDVDEGLFRVSGRYPISIMSQFEFELPSKPLTLDLFSEGLAIIKTCPTEEVR
jgi:hypothetical protein